MSEYRLYYSLIGSYRAGIPERKPTRFSFFLSYSEDDMNSMECPILFGRLWAGMIWKIFDLKQFQNVIFCVCAGQGKLQPKLEASKFSNYCQFDEMCFVMAIFMKWLGLSYF